MKKFPLYVIATALVLIGMQPTAQAQQQDALVSINTDKIINEHYIGNGAQWDPYQLDYGKAKFDVSDIDWQKLYDRLDFMQPQFMRVMMNTTSYVKDGKLKPEKFGDQLFKILRYCTENDITVMFGDWGGGMVNSESNEVQKKNIRFTAQLVDYLINQKEFSSIKYFNIVNEPNGFWSATDGNYDLWSRAAGYLHGQFVDRGLTDQLSLVGPDVAIWDTEESWWVDSTATDLGNAMGLYDIHTYPSKVTVNSGEFSNIIGAYKEEVPKDKKIVMGEIGFKFVEDADSLLDQENKRRAKAKKYASVEDSQMFVYDYVYGTDMADALFQTVNQGYSGSIVWMLDDAMYSKEAPHKLKVWGFWNILGEEFFGAEEEKVRPWFYAWSLLSKYMPAGSQVFDVQTSGDDTVKAITIEKDGKYMLAVVNVSKENKTVKLQSAGTELASLNDAKKFLYAKGKLIKKGDHAIKPNKRGLSLNLSEGIVAEMPSESLIVYTNFEY